jgi:hypothetical protein
MTIIRDHAALSDLWSVAHPSTNRESSFNTMLTPQEAISRLGVTADSPLNSYSAGKPLDQHARKSGGKRLDYILYRQPSRPRRPAPRSYPILKCGKCQVVFTDKVPGYNFSFSDHFGLEAMFEIQSNDEENLPVPDETTNYGVESQHGNPPHQNALELMYAKLLSQVCWKQCVFSPPLPSYPLTLSTASTSATSPRNSTPLSVISPVCPHAHPIISSLSPHDPPCPCTLHWQTYPASPCFQTAMQSPALPISLSTVSKQSLLIVSWRSTAHVRVSSPSFITLQTALTPPATKLSTIVAGQTSAKAPEKAAFEKYLPADVHIVLCHSLHGPTVSPMGQPLVHLYVPRGEVNT